MDLKRPFFKHLGTHIMVNTLLLLKLPYVKKWHLTTMPYSLDHDIKLKKWDVFPLLGKLFGK
jgi:hypothetical protein